MYHALVVMLSLGALLLGVDAAEEAKFDPEVQALSYSIGYQVGGDFKRQGLNINPDMVIRGIQDALEGVEPLMTEDEMERALVGLQNKAQAAQEVTDP